MTFIFGIDKFDPESISGQQMKRKLSLKSFPQGAIKEAIGIILLASIVGFVVNRVHPEGVRITIKRPSLKFAPDTLLANDLPGVSISPDQAIEVQQAEPTDELLLIATAQVLQLRANGQALLIDARSEQEFADCHIPDARNLPYKNLSANKAKLDSLPQDKWLICYCDGPPCDQAELLAREIVTAGYELVAVYFDGLNGWKKVGNAVEGQKEMRTNAR